jgi:hypothetical protein
MSLRLSEILNKENVYEIWILVYDKKWDRERWEFDTVWDTIEGAKNMAKHLGQSYKIIKTTQREVVVEDNKE